MINGTLILSELKHKPTSEILSHFDILIFDNFYWLMHGMYCIIFFACLSLDMFTNFKFRQISIYQESILTLCP